MRALFALALLCAPAHAASVHLQTIEHTGTFASIPTTKQIVYSGNVDFGSRRWVVNYEDADLGVTTWEASEADVKAWQAQARVIPRHTGFSHSLTIGEHPLRALFTSVDIIPMNVSFGGTSGNSTVTYTKIAHAYVFVPTGMEMELSPFTQVGGQWQATQTVRIYGAVPEPGGWVMLLVGLCGYFALGPGRLSSPAFTQA